MLILGKNSASAEKRNWEWRTKTRQAKSDKDVFAQQNLTLQAELSEQQTAYAKLLSQNQKN